MTLRVVSNETAAVFGDQVSGSIHGSGINQQNRNAILYRVNATALPAFQAGRILFQNERLFTGRAHQDVEQILRNHDESF